MKGTRVIAVSSVLVGAMLCASAAQANTAAPLPASDYATESACAAPGSGHVSCLAQLLVAETSAARAHRSPLGMTRSAPIAAAKASEGAYGLRPQDLRAAYFPGEAPDAPASEPQTIALVDAYNDLEAEADLKVYDEEFSLPQCTAANGCFEQVNQSGETSNLPFPESEQAKREKEALCESATAEPSVKKAACKEVEEADEWAAETALDIEVSHAICQNCRIMLVEASEGEWSNLEAAENTAVRLGATEVSNSWAGGEPPTDSEAFNHPGTVITAAAGDNGYLDAHTSKEEEELYGITPGTVNYPASSPHVVAVGGTNLTLSATAKAWSKETAWYNGGGGCSLDFKADIWQSEVLDWSGVGCEDRRAVSDVSADADPYTGAAVYDSVPYVRPGHGLKTARVFEWTPIGGTSLASPIIASMFALAGGSHGVAYPAQTLYSHLGSAQLHDVTEGGNGVCGGEYSSGCSGSMKPLSITDCGQGVWICNPAPGYDGPSGVGTPNGIAALKPTRQHTGGGPEAPITEECGEPFFAGAGKVCGTLNPHTSGKAGYYFAYNKGTNCTGGKETLLQTEAQGEHIKVSGELFGLEAETKYAYCLIATDASGETLGQTLTFTTEPAAPRPPQTSPAIDVTSDSATLEGGLGPQPITTSWYFQYAPQFICTWEHASTTAEQQDTKLGETDEVAAAVTNLQPGTEYHVCLVAKNRIGATIGGERSFLTDSTAPSVDSVSAQSTSSEATIEARISPNAQTATCEVRYGTSEAYGSIVPCQEGLGNNGERVLASAYIRDLKASTMYYYQVIVENTVGKSSPSEGKGAVMTAPNKPAVTNESASSVSTTTAVLAGAIKPELASTQYNFEYGETKALGQSTPEREVGGGSGEVPVSPETITDLNPGTTYYYRLRAVNISGVTVGEAKTLTTATSSPIVAAVIPVVIPTTPITTTTGTTTRTGTVTTTLAFSDLLLPAVQHGRSLSVGLTVGAAGSRVEVDVMVPAAQASSTKKGGKPKPVVLARLVRASVAAGRLKLTVPLNAKGKQALARHKYLMLTVKITVTPPTGQPQTANAHVTLKDH